MNLYALFCLVLLLLYYFAEFDYNEKNQIRKVSEINLEKSSDKTLILNEPIVNKLEKASDNEDAEIWARLLAPIKFIPYIPDIHT